MLHTRVGTKAVLNTQRKSISTAIRKEPEISYGLMHHFFKPLKLTLQNHSSDYWINIFQSLIHYTRLQKYYQSQLYEQCVAIHKTKHNKNVFNKKEKETNSCNCRNKNECPLNGNYKVQNVIYICTVSETQIFKKTCLFGNG